VPTQGAGRIPKGRGGEKGQAGRRRRSAQLPREFGSLQRRTPVGVTQRGLRRAVRGRAGPNEVM
jgi:hypothetical protein